MVIDLELPSEDHQKDVEDSRSHLSRIEKDYVCETHTGDGPTTNSLRPDEFEEESEQTSAGCTSNSKHRVHAGGVADVNPHRDLEPHNGMEFDSKEDAFTFYKEYAKSVGFASIIKASRRSRISGKFIDAKFVCTRYGKKRESVTAENPESVLDANDQENIPVKRKRGRINESLSKTDCQACMHVKGRQDGRWFINSFIKEHNHEIFPDQAYYHRGQWDRELGSNRVTSFHAIRARTKKVYVSMSRKSGTTKKVENKKSEIVNASRETLALEEGDAQIMLQHFLNMQVENPNFFSAIDLNPGQRLRNVFWVNAKERLDYEHFSDVVFFDTTYIKNEYKLPFVPFIGVNHHAQFMLLGCVLIADQSKSNFVWGMQAWLKAMGGRAPKVILTDQDKALKEAVAEVFPNSRHCFCLWHVLTKIQEKIGFVMRRNENFLAKFNKCVLKSWDEEQFEKRWWKMVDRFGLRNDTWIQSLYEDCKQWVPAYMTDIFLAGISTPRRSESINTLVDKLIQRKSTLTEFLDQYKTCLYEKSEEEAKADFETWHKQPGLRSPSPFGKQMAQMYTHAIFKKFQVEVLGVVACHPKKVGDDGSIKTYIVQDFEENQDFMMIWNERTFSICCSCHLFEYNGFLCRHVMIVLQMCGVHNIPSQYILKRWTKDAKSRQNMGHLEVVESRSQRYNNLCQRALKLGDEGSLSEESYNIAFKALEETLRKCERVNFSIQSMLEPCSPSLHSFHDLELNQDNCTSKKTKEGCGSRKGTERARGNRHACGMATAGLCLFPVYIPSGTRSNRAPDGIDEDLMYRASMSKAHSALRAPIFDCSYESQEAVQVTEQLNTRVPSLDAYFGTQLVHGMGQLNSTLLHDADLLSQQRLLGMGQLNFRPQMMQGCFDMQHNLRDMEHSDVRPVVLHAMGSKQSQSKHLPL
ncbi:protein FAR1-RELATED SEQUENCE 1 isoform X5 [Daucus carota subsp. sativus]|uniref:protein FAR1-RELATED SEQUENCE 1 isoform X5 n=1 Tax=Daucus carota subsp. sativus TaxID=79200 RepID=UPI003082A4E3